MLIQPIVNNVFDAPHYILENSEPGLLFPWDDEAFIINEESANKIHHLYGGWMAMPVRECTALWLWEPVWMDIFGQ